MTTTTQIHDQIKPLLFSTQFPFCIFFSFPLFSLANKQMHNQIKPLLFPPNSLLYFL